jgi:hypothetical protein
VTLPVKFPQFQPPGDTYSRQYFEQHNRALEEVFAALNAKGALLGSTMTLTSTPAAGYGLRTGALFELEGVVHIVRDKDIFFAPVVPATSALGAVTTSP